MYDYCDKIIAYLDKVIVKHFRKLKSVLALDEINKLEAVNEVYEDLDREIRTAFKKLADHTYGGYIPFGVIPNIAWLTTLLNSYDPVSKYVYTNEWDRKRARLFEALVASATPLRELDGAMKALSLQMRLYAVRVTDEAALTALKDSYIRVVEWVAEDDSRTCSVCRARDGKRYRIDKVPVKPHINCRCYLKGVIAHERTGVPTDFRNSGFNPIDNEAR